jgi:hypothetical protein
MAKNNNVRTWNNHGNTYLYSPATKKAVKRVAGKRGRPSYSEADIKKVPDNAEELAVDDLSTQAQRALGIIE